MFDIGNKHYEFFDMLNQHAKYFNQGAKIMYDVMINYSKAQTKMEEIKTIEKQADNITSETVQKLNQVFITPIDREDVIGIAENLDEVIDLTEEIIQRFYMYDIHFMHDDAKKFVKLIVRSCEALSNAMADFRNCKKSNTFKSLIYQVNQLEDEADELYIKLIRQLYTEEREHSMRVIVWTRLLDAMEDCVDQCELVANKMNTVMVKYA